MNININLILIFIIQIAIIQMLSEKNSTALASGNILYCIVQQQQKSHL